MALDPLQPGDQRHGFTVTARTPLPELNLTLIQLAHEKTGARMLHVETDDDNNLFAVGFRTPPDDSTGVAHILEHTVLCGSKRYPVRDPFFSMIKRSLNTFMNAMTASDWTLYPFSSQNEKDFYNLFDIYLDAAFFPLLRDRDFLQEGHRLEFTEANDPTSPLLYKGVVYNEMKGAMASPSSLLGRRLNRSLFPTTTYRHNSGGEPSDIPDLTWEELRAFHASYYHPSNAWFFTYGNFDPVRHLQMINDKVLSHFDAAPVASEVPPEQRFSAPKTVRETFPLDPAESPERKSMVQLAWLTCEIDDSFDRLALTLLTTLLIGNPAAPLYRELLESRHGDNLAPGSGYHDDYRTNYFAIGLQGTKADAAEAVEALILKTLEECARSGFTRERIEAAIHRLEFSHREVVGNHYPYSLGLLMRLIGPWMHCDDPISPLQLDENLARLRRELESGPFFETLIRRTLLDNPHRLTFTLAPDTTQQQREDEALRQGLDALQEKLTQQEQEKIVAQSAMLQAAQDEKEDLSSLPTLQLSDIPPTERIVSGSTTPCGGHEVNLFDQPTNGIGYFISHFDTTALPEELIDTLPIFCTLLTQMGTEKESYLQLAERMEAGTGGISAGVEILEHPHQAGAFLSVLELRGKALERNQEALFAILTDICTRPSFTDRNRLKTVLNQARVSLENAIPGSGHSFAARAAASGLTPAGARRERWTGLSQYRTIRTLAGLDDADLDGLIAKLQAIAQHLFRAPLLHCGVTTEERMFPAMLTPLAPYLQALPTTPVAATAEEAPFRATPGRLGRATSVPVSFVSRVFPTVPYVHADSAPLAVLARLLRAGYLHREIREKGGAYGGLASYDCESGLFSLLSYRDPQLVRTLRVYDSAATWAAAGDFARSDIDEAILAVFGDLDRPLSPGGRGGRAFTRLRQGIDPELRQQFRQQVLDVDAEALARVAQSYLVDGRPQSAVAVISSEEALRQANRELGEESLSIERI